MTDLLVILIQQLMTCSLYSTVRVYDTLLAVVQYEYLWHIVAQSMKRRSDSRTYRYALHTAAAALVTHCTPSISQ